MSANTPLGDGSLVPPIPDEWLEYFYHHQFNEIDELDVPFAGTAVSADTGVEDKSTTPGINGFFDAPGPETVFVEHDDTGTGNTTETSAAAGSATGISLNNSPAAGDENNTIDLSPKGGIAKQVKRRSRASRRTPTTSVNSSIKNFRSIVQQYTGYQSSSSTSGFNRDGKGPINLNFSAPADRNDSPFSFGLHY